MIVAQALDRLDLSVRHLGEGDDAGADWRAVDQHGAGATLSFAAPFLGPGEAALLAKDIEEAAHRLGVDVRRLSVQREAHPTIPFLGELALRSEATNARSLQVWPELRGGRGRNGGARSRRRAPGRPSA